MKSRKVSVGRMLALVVGVCIVVLLILGPWRRAGPPHPSPRDKTETAAPSPPSRSLPGRIHPGDQTPGKDSAVRFGILGPHPGAAEWYHPLSVALRCVKACDCPVEVVAPPGTDPASLRSLLQGENINVGTCSLDTALKRSSVLLALLNEKADNATLSRLKAYVASGGWLLVVNNPPLVRTVASLPGGALRQRINAWGVASEKYATKARFLVGHPITPGLQSREWFPVPTLEGEVEISRPGISLWLVAFRNPSSPGLRILAVGKGGVVEINWLVCKSSNLDRVESREVLRNTLAWFSEKRFWRPPERIPPQEVTGTVVDEDGSPIAGADVTARVWADWGEKVGETAAQSDDNGLFSLAATAPAIYWFEASKEGFSQEDPFVMARCEEGSEQESVTIVLRRTVALSGTVNYEGRENAPASEFPVTLVPIDRDPGIEKQTTVTDQHGEFAFEKVPYGKTLLLFSQKGEWAGWNTVDLPFEPEEEPDRVVVSIERVALVHGRVVEHKTLIPIAGARVEITPCYYDRALFLFSGGLTRVEESDEEKGFSFRLPPGLWYVTGVAEGYRDVVVREKGQPKMLGTMYLMVASGTLSETGDKIACPILLQLEKTAKSSKKTQFYGTVYLPSGKPAPNALIRCGNRHVARSDSEGKYETEPILDGGAKVINGRLPDGFIFVVRCGNFAGFHKLLLPEPPERYHLDLWLEEGRPARGFVRDIKGNPVEGAKVTSPISGDPREKEITEEAEAVFSEADGSFTFPALVPRSDLPAGSSVWIFTLLAEKTVETGDDCERYVGKAVVYVPENEPIEDFDIVIAKVGPVITGTVSYHDGTPMRNHRVSVGLHGEGREGGRLTDFATHWDDHGRFSIEGRGFNQNINLWARGIDRENWRSPPSLPPETYELQVHVAEWAQHGPSTVKAGSTMIVKGVQAGMTDLDIRFPPMGSIRARVIDGESGLPAEDFSVRVSATGTHDDERRPLGSAWTEGADLGGPIPEGEFHMLDLLPGPSGTYRLEIRSDEYCNRRFEDVPVAGNQKTDLGNIPFYRNWWVIGRVIAPEIGEPVVATVTGRGDATTTTDDQGYFALMLPRAGGGHYSTVVRVIPVDKTWKETYVGGLHALDGPTVDVGDVLLQRASPE